MLWPKESLRQYDAKDLPDLRARWRCRRSHTFGSNIDGRQLSG